MTGVTIAFWFFVIGLFFFPLLQVLLAYRAVPLKRLFDFIAKSGNLALNFTSILVKEYTLTVFPVNALGAIANLLDKTYKLIGLPDELLVQLLIYHVALFIISASGIAIIGVARTRVLFAFVGEILTNWALMSGCLMLFLLILTLFLLVGMPVLLLVLAVVVVYIIVVLYKVTMESVKTYVEGAKCWK